MFKNYLKIAFRNFWKHRGYTFINIFGLAIGLACVFLITLFIYDELSFDRFHDHADRIYLVTEYQDYERGTLYVSVTPGPLAHVLETEYPEVTEAVRYRNINNAMFKVDEQTFRQSRGAFVDPEFLEVFDFPLQRGNIETVLNDLSSIVISERMAEKFFGDENPIGETVLLEGSYPMTITGVMENIPHNSHIRPDFLINFKVMENYDPGIMEWGSNSLSTYILLVDNADAAELDQKITGLIKERAEGAVASLTLQPLTRIQLHSYFGWGPKQMGAIKYIYIAGVSVLFILVISVINFVSITTARFTQRAREVGVRKVVGAQRISLIRQFLGESVIQTIIGVSFALILVEFFFPTFNRITQKSLDWALFGHPILILSLIVLIASVTLLAGFYPALFLSGFKPVSVLKGKLNIGRSGAYFRKGLILFQWMLSVVMIIGTTVVYGQMKFVQTKDMGYDREGIIYFSIPESAKSQYYAFKNEISRLSGVTSVTAVNDLPNQIGSSTSGVDWQGKNPDERALISYQFVDYNFTETFGIDVTQGRSFSQQNTTDSSSAFLVNQAAVRLMGYDEPIGKQMRWWDTEGTVIGVMEDFHISSLRSEIQPHIVRIEQSQLREVCVKYNEGDVQPVIASLENTFRNFYPDGAFEYHFFDETFEAQYRAEQRMGDIFKYVAILSIFIACLGLFGLSAFMAEQRTKEISIRKALGATLANIVSLIYREFIILALLANVIAIPAAWIFMRQWLNNFAYHMDLNLWIFLGAAAAALTIVLITVSINGLKAGRLNPAHSLKYE